MYYDPMISKLIAWAPNRDEAMKLLGTAIEEYVIRGVTHNLGFGSSILSNEGFRTGNYSTSFIPLYYPTGFTGDLLNAEDHNYLALATHFVRTQLR